MGQSNPKPASVLRDWAGRTRTRIQEEAADERVYPSIQPAAWSRSGPAANRRADCPGLRASERLGLGRPGRLPSLAQH